MELQNIPIKTVDLKKIIGRRIKIWKGISEYSSFTDTLLNVERKHIFTNSDTLHFSQITKIELLP